MRNGCVQTESVASGAEPARVKPRQELLGGEVPGITLWTSRSKLIFELLGVDGVDLQQAWINRAGVGGFAINELKEFGIVMIEKECPNRKPSGEAVTKHLKVDNCDFRRIPVLYKTFQDLG